MKHIDRDSKQFKGFQTFRKKLQKRLITLRKNSKFSQKDMAQFDINYRTYERMESDIENITTLWQLYKVAEAYGVSMSELMDV